MRIWTIALAATLGLANGGWCAARTTRSRRTRPAAVKAPVPLDISRWPAFAGATLVQETNMDGDQIKSLAEHVPAEQRGNLAGLMRIQVRAYTLPVKTDPRRVIGFYEPRALAAGYKLMNKEFDTEDGPEGTCVYISQGSGILVVTVDADEGKPKVEIVAVTGRIKDLAALGALTAPRPAPAPAKAAPAAPPAPAPDPDR